jgi:hypothetical protein
MSEHEKLGAHRQTYLPAPRSGDVVVRGCGLIAGGLVAVGILCASAGALPAGAALGGLALIPAAVAALRGRRIWRGARLDLFERGMTMHRSGVEIVAFRWDTAEVRQQVVPFQNSGLATEYSLTMTAPDGRTVAFDDSMFAGAREWGPAIQSAITATQLPHAVTDIDNEQTVRFGDITVSFDELAYGGRSYPWGAVQIFDAHSGMVRLKVSGQWVSLVPVGDIPNFYIFNEVAERLRIAASGYREPDTENR